MNHRTSTALSFRNGKPKFDVAADGCWIWNGCIDRNGYGMCSKRGGPDQYAHRSVYVHLRGPIPPGMTIDHLCRNRSCVNPDHLEVVSLKENVRRSPRTKLNTEAVAEIRSSRDSNRALARKFGVTRQAIYRVRKGLSWN